MNIPQPIWHPIQNAQPMYSNETPSTFGQFPHYNMATSSSNDGVVRMPPHMNEGEITHDIFIDSQDRDTDIYSSANNFMVHFNGNGGVSGAQIHREFKKVVSVELVSAQLPSSIFSSARYVVLCIDEIDKDDTFHGTSERLDRNTFAILYPDTTYGSYIICRLPYPNPKRSYVKNPLTRISRMRISFYDETNTLAAFGNDDISLHLRIKTLEYKI